MTSPYIRPSPVQILGEVEGHLAKSDLAFITRMVLSNKIQGLNFGAPLLGLPKSYIIRK